MRGIAHISLGLGSLSVRGLRNAQKFSKGVGITDMQLRRNNPMCVCAKTFSTLTSLLFFFSFLFMYLERPRAREKKNTLSWRKIEWNSLKSSFFLLIPLFRAGFPVWAERGKAVDGLWLRQCSGHCNCLNYPMIGAHTQGSHSITYESRQDCGSPSSGKKKTGSGSEFKANIYSLCVNTETLQQIGYTSI